MFIVHLFGGWQRFPVYDFARDGTWYQLGFLVGTGSPFFGFLGRRRDRERGQPIAKLDD